MNDLTFHITDTFPNQISIFHEVFVEFLVRLFYFSVAQVHVGICNDFHGEARGNCRFSKTTFLHVWCIILSFLCNSK